MSQNKTGKYFKYAIGEIVLVVIGILIALQINNWNEARKERQRELTYLNSVKGDLIKELANNNHFANLHFDKASACTALLNGDAPQTIEEVRVYTDTYEKVFAWFSFAPNNNTFKELLSSGNLSLITNDAIKNGLLELEQKYAEIGTGEYHMRREYEAYLYDVHVENISALEFFDITDPQYGLPKRLTANDIPPSRHTQLIQDATWQHNSQTFRNGLKLAMMNNGHLAMMHRDLVAYIEQLIGLIDDEVDEIAPLVQ